jgi:hypothetical protein
VLGPLAAHGEGRVEPTALQGDQRLALQSYDEALATARRAGLRLPMLEAGD